MMTVTTCIVHLVLQHSERKGCRVSQLIDYAFMSQVNKKLRKLDNLSKNTKTFKCSNGCVHTSLISLDEAYLKKADRKADRKIKITLDWLTHGLLYIISDLVSRQMTVLLLTWTYFRIHFFVALQLLNDGFENIGQRWIVINSKVDSSRFF